MDSCSSHLCFHHPSTGLSGAMASISVRSGAPGSPTHMSGSSSSGGGSSSAVPTCRSRRNGLQDVDLNTFISEEMALHLDSTGSASAGGGGTRKRNSTQCSDVITDSPTHKRNRMIWPTCPCVCERVVRGSVGLLSDRQTDRQILGYKKKKKWRKNRTCWMLVQSVWVLSPLPFTIHRWSARCECVCRWRVARSADIGAQKGRLWAAPRSLKKRRHTVLLNEQKPLDLHTFVPLPHLHPSP